MSVVDLETLLNDDLRKMIASLAVLEDWSDEYGQCGHPSLLDKEGPCTKKDREPPDVVNKEWSDFGRRAKLMLSTLKADFRKEVEQCLLLDCLKKLVTQISGQNTENMTKYMEKMTTLVSSFKESFKKDETATVGVATGKVTKLTKPTKVPS